MRRKDFANLVEGDPVNDPDFKYAAGRVKAVGPGWFDVEWTRATVTYVKRHTRDALDSGHLVAW
jgi:hypothetical protein